MATVTITTTPAAPFDGGATITVNFAWDEAVTGFTSADIRLSDLAGSTYTIDNFTGSGQSYSCTITLPNLTTAIRMIVAADAADQGNPQAFVIYSIRKVAIPPVIGAIATPLNFAINTVFNLTVSVTGIDTSQAGNSVKVEGLLEGFSYAFNNSTKILTITGTPTRLSSGASMKIRATNPDGTTPKNALYNVVPAAPVIGQATAPIVYKGQAYSFFVPITNRPPSPTAEGLWAGFTYKKHKNDADQEGLLIAADSVPDNELTVDGGDFTVNAPWAGGLVSRRFAFTIADATPGIPQNVTATEQVNGVKMAWDAPSTVGASTVLRYERRVKRSSATNWGRWVTIGSRSHRSATLNLSVGTWDIQLRAVNTQGAGAASATVTQQVRYYLSIPSVSNGTVTVDEAATVHIPVTTNAASLVSIRRVDRDRYGRVRRLPSWITWDAANSRVVLTNPDTSQDGLGIDDNTYFLAALLQFALRVTGVSGDVRTRLDVMPSEAVDAAPRFDASTTTTSLWLGRASGSQDLANTVREVPTISVPSDSGWGVAVSRATFAYWKDPASVGDSVVITVSNSRGSDSITLHVTA